jgi:hypothetical protein
VPSLVEIEEQVVQVSWGRSTTAAVVAGGKVYVWGEVDGEVVAAPAKVEEFSRYGVQVERVSWGGEVVGYLTSNGEVFMGFNGGVQLVQLPEKAIDVKWGEKKALVLTKSGFVYEVEGDQTK